MRSAVTRSSAEQKQWSIASRRRGRRSAATSSWARATRTRATRGRHREAEIAQARHDAEFPPRPRSPPGPRAGGRGHRGRRTSGAVRPLAPRSVEIAAQHARAGSARLESGPDRRERLRLDLPLAAFGTCTRVELDRRRPARQRRLGPRDRQQPGSGSSGARAASRTPVRRRPRRLPRGIGVSERARPRARAPAWNRPPPERQRARGHLLEREHVGLALPIAAACSASADPARDVPGDQANQRVRGRRPARRPDRGGGGRGLDERI